LEEGRKKEKKKKSPPNALKIQYRKKKPLPSNGPGKKKEFQCIQQAREKERGKNDGKGCYAGKDREGKKAPTPRRGKKAISDQFDMGGL